MKFIVDGMLGRLARWLLILGYDTRYDANIADNDLLTISKKETRVILTRDEELYKRAVAKKILAVLVKGEYEAERLAFLHNNIGVRLDFDKATTRCPDCGQQLRKVSKIEVSTEVPPASLERYNEYWRCTNCGKIYWIGSHWKQIKYTLEQARRLSLQVLND